MVLAGYGIFDGEITTVGLRIPSRSNRRSGDGGRYAYRLSDKGTKVALLFVLFHKQLCGPLANSLFHHRPAVAPRPKSKLETAFHKADDSLSNIIHLLEAA